MARHLLRRSGEYPPREGAAGVTHRDRAHDRHKRRDGSGRVRRELVLALACAAQAMVGLTAKVSVDQPPETVYDAVLDIRN